MDASEFALSALAFVLTYAIHSTLLLGVVCLVAPRIVRSLALRERLWKTAMFGGLFTALVQVGASMETPLFHWTLAAHDATEELAAQSESEPRDAARSESVLERGFAPQSRPEDEPEGLVLASAPERDHDGEPQSCDERAAPAATSWVARTGRLASGAVVGLRTQLALLSATRGASPSSADDGATALASSPARVETPERTSDSPLAASLDNESWPAALARGWRAWTVHGLALWALFALAVLLVFASMCVRLMRCMRGRTELDSGPLREALDRLVRQAFPAGRRVRLYAAPELRAPVSLGWLRPAICVPPRALVELSADEQESMLAHELAHLVRRDPLWLSAAWLIERVFFFQPLHRVARAELHDLAELACDEWAARRTGDRLALASCLARIAEWIIAAPRALPATSMAEHHGRCRLTQRIERLLDDESGPVREERARRWLAPAVATGLGALVFVAPGVSAPAEESSPLATELDTSARSATAPVDGREEPDSSDSTRVNTWPTASLAPDGELVAPLDDNASLQSPNSLSTAPEPDAAQDERASIGAELARLDESLSVLRDELAPLREAARDLDGDEQLARTLAAIARRVDNLERRSRALREVIQVLETLESKPAHPSSTSFDFQGSRSLP